MLLLSFSCSVVSVARLPTLLIVQKPALLLGFSLVVIWKKYIQITEQNKRKLQVEMNKDKNKKKFQPRMNNNKKQDISI